MGQVKVLDTYVLCEILQGNKNYFSYLEGDFVLADLTLVEFYWVILREYNESTAHYWLSKLQLNSFPCSLELMAKAMMNRKKIKKSLSFFDAVGYTLALEQNMPFVTGDKEFKSLPGVEFIPK